MAIGHHQVSPGPLSIAGCFVSHQYHKLNSLLCIKERLNALGVEHALIPRDCFQRLQVYARPVLGIDSNHSSHQRDTSFSCPVYMQSSLRVVVPFFIIVQVALIDQQAIYMAGHQGHIDCMVIGVDFSQQG